MEATTPGTTSDSRYFGRQLLEPSGLPRYSAQKLYPIEVQNCAEAIQLLAKAAIRDPQWLEVAETTRREVTRHLLLWDGEAEQPLAYFRLQHGRWLRNDLASVRWGQAPMLLALKWLRTARKSHGSSWTDHSKCGYFSTLGSGPRGPSGRLDFAPAAAAVAGTDSHLRRPGVHSCVFR